MAQLLPIFAALAFGCAAAFFLWSGVSGYLTQSGRLSRRLLEGSGRFLDTSQDARLIDEDNALGKFERYLMPSDEDRASRIRSRLYRAGYRGPAAVRVYFATKWGVALAGFAAGALFLSSVADPAQKLYPILSVLFIVTFAFFATDMWVERKIVYRRMDVERAFPDALDLMLVCIEAGHGLDQAISRVAEEIGDTAPVLSEELTLAVGQIRAGKDRNRVLSDFAARCGVDDVAAFVAVIKQADKFGVSIAETLRVYAAEMRNKRYMRAEEKANMMPVKLALGAIMFTVPPTIIVLIGPSILMIAREMARAAGAGG